MYVGSFVCLVIYSVVILIASTYNLTKPITMAPPYYELVHSAFDLVSVALSDTEIVLVFVGSCVCLVI
jgi:hypothetical protein